MSPQFTYINCLSIEFQLREVTHKYEGVRWKGTSNAQVVRKEVIKRDRGLGVAVWTQTQPQDTDSN